MSAESAYYKTFDDQSEDELPPEMKAVYGNIRLGHVARIVLAAYGEQNDLLPLTSSIFVGRIQGDPRMKYEVMPIFEERRRSMVAALTSETIASKPLSGLHRWLARDFSTDNQVTTNRSSSTTVEGSFDPRILRDFENEIAAWPSDQAQTALLIIRATLAGDEAVINRLFGELTVGHLRSVNNVIHKIHGE